MLVGGAAGEEVRARLHPDGVVVGRDHRPELPIENRRGDGHPVRKPRSAVGAVRRRGFLDKLAAAMVDEHAEVRAAQRAAEEADGLEPPLERDLDLDLLGDAGGNRDRGHAVGGDAGDRRREFEPAERLRGELRWRHRGRLPGDGWFGGLGRRARGRRLGGVGLDARIVREGRARRDQRQSDHGAKKAAGAKEIAERGRAGQIHHVGLLNQVFMRLFMRLFMLRRCARRVLGCRWLFEILPRLRGRSDRDRGCPESEQGGSRVAPAPLCLGGVTGGRTACRQPVGVNRSSCRAGPPCRIRRWCRHH